MRPVEARTKLHSLPEVSAWYAAHSAPEVLAGMAMRDARRWRKYTPSLTVDLVKEGLRMELFSEVGPPPHRVEALLDRGSGKVLSLQFRP